jgi:hypothetical protein
MRTLTPALQAEVDKHKTTPAFLVEILFDPPLHLSSRGDRSLLGSDWEEWDVGVSGIGQDSAAGAGGQASLKLGNTDLSISTVILSQGIAGRQVTIWQFYGSAPDSDDVMEVFRGIAGEASISGDRAVAIALKREEQSVLFSPRNYITRKEGFSFLIAPGTIMNFNGEVYRLEPEQ